MFYKMLSVQLCLLVLSSCNNSNEGKAKLPDPKSDSIAKQTEPLAEKQKVDTIILDSSVKISSRSRIEILSTEKFVDSTAIGYNRSKDKCSGWNLTSESIKEILLKSAPIDFNELHYYYDVFPCYYSGKLTVDGRRAEYTINAGASSHIHFKDTSFALGYKRSDFKKYFLLGPGI